MTSYLVVANDGDYHLSFVSLPRPFSHPLILVQLKGNPLSVIDNWGALHKDNNGQWINDVAWDKYDNMKKKKDEVMEKLIQEAPEGTIFDSIRVPLEDKFGIMAENLGRKGKYVNGVGLFPRMDTFSCISSMASSSEGQTSNKESDGNNSSSENVYPELEEHDLESILLNIFELMWFNS
ncbi:unnamed protein product [Malus baccata var. baccata]